MNTCLGRRVESRALECEKSKVPLWREQEKETDRERKIEKERECEGGKQRWAKLN